MGGSDCFCSEIGGDACGFLLSRSFSLPLIIVNILVHETKVGQTHILCYLVKLC